MSGKRLTESQWKDLSDLRAHWHSFTDADHVPEDFVHRMERAGYVRLRAVRKSDLEESFAAERGIEAGGYLWELTKKGRRDLSPTGVAPAAFTDGREG